MNTVFDLVYEEGGFIHGVHHTMNEDDVKTVMRVPWVSIGSDGSALNQKYPGKPHPRSFGTNPRVLGKYTREEKVLTLEDAVRKMTSMPAQVLGLKIAACCAKVTGAMSLFSIRIRWPTRRATRIRSNIPRGSSTYWSTAPW